MTNSLNFGYKHKQAADFIRSKLSTVGLSPKVFMVLGSGFRDVVASWNVVSEISMAEIPGYPTPKVQGHGTHLIGARVRTNKTNVDVLIATGRVHLYEGFPVHSVTFPIFLAHELGIDSIVLTNAAGAISLDAKPGMVIAISDHLNLTGHNIAAALTPDYKYSFVEMTHAYDPIWRDYVCKESGISSGIYAGMFGPTFETPAEAKMLRSLGADLAGMSTVQEVIAARMLGKKVFACSFVTNIAGGKDVEHADVLKSVSDNFPTIKKTLEAALSFT